VTSAVPGLVQITESARQDLYDVLAIPADFGTGYEVHKRGQGGETYHVLLAPADNGPHSCECLGHLRWGWKTRCRHVGGLLTLRQAGKL
jgi:hypothetical protein